MRFSSTEPQGFISQGIKRERAITGELKGSVYTYLPGEVTESAFTTSLGGTVAPGRKACPQKPFH